ncbi:hypothetical protein AMELA_G00293120 [Ameiurus melas]|uniref:Uncharacterized protein n=1 Tax=Ameiurus melas TaxID=219545 RepID=A0A7J5ZIH4_AMEME|nr:hypothetical protein AMELA_G00293120 [Ameiurus melas]
MTKFRMDRSHVSDQSGCAADSGAGLTELQEQKQCQRDCSSTHSVLRSLELVFLGVLRKMAENREKATDQMKIWKESRGSQLPF